MDENSEILVEPNENNCILEINREMKTTKLYSMQLNHQAKLNFKSFNCLRRYLLRFKKFLQCMYAFIILPAIVFLLVVAIKNPDNVHYNWIYDSSFHLGEEKLLDIQIINSSSSSLSFNINSTTSYYHITRGFFNPYTNHTITTINSTDANTNANNVNSTVLIYYQSDQIYQYEKPLVKSFSNLGFMIGFYICVCLWFSFTICLQELSNIFIFPAQFIWQDLRTTTHLIPPIIDIIISYLPNETYDK